VFRNLIWDFDGTLFDTYPAIVDSLRSAVTDLAGATPAYEEVRDLALVSVDVCVATMSTTYDIPLDDLEAVFDQRYRNVTAEDQPPFDGVAEVCELVCAGGGLNLIVTHRRRSGMERLLSAHALSGLFTDAVTHEDGYPHKPDPASFLMLMERHGLESGHTLGVGDREIDVLAAHAAGLRAALFAPTPGNISADFMLSDFGTLSRMIALPA
jgi:phosphoglycolate phosphatase-like HAD superfamily hydrolase